MKAPGTVRGDRGIYAGRSLIGTTRSTTGGVIAFNADGRIVGTFPNEKTAAAALDQAIRPGDRS
jgi:hypothetical protein